MTNATTIPVDADKLRTFITGVLRSMEVPEADAGFVAGVLVEADLRGVDSHGATRLTGYVGMMDRGYVNPMPDIKVISQMGSTTLLDGDLAFGMLVARKGMDMAIANAREHGMGMTVSRNMTHTGLLGYYTMTAAANGFIGMTMNNGPVIVPPYGSTTPLFATNPFSVAFPADKEEPIVLDMATSMVAAGKLRIAEKRGDKIPMDWGLDRDGNPTDDPTEVLQHGHLQWAGGYKGFGLATMIESMTGVLSGGLFGLDSPELKHFGEDPLLQSGAYIAINIEAFMPLNEYKQRVDRLVQMIHSTQKAPNADGVYISGQLEFERKRDRTANGIPMSSFVHDELQELSQRFGIDFAIDR